MKDLEAVTSEEERQIDAGTPCCRRRSAGYLLADFPGKAAMASKTTLNAKNLEALGAERLAELLIEITTGDAARLRRQHGRKDSFWGLVP